MLSPCAMHADLSSIAAACQTDASAAYIGKQAAHQGITYWSGSASVSDLQGYNHCGVESTTDDCDHTSNL
jgi:hypothetical protein